MSTAPTHTCRRLRFSLRTLLLLVAVCAVATWIYLTGWPWLVAYWQQVRFERQVRQMKAGISPWGALCVLESKPVQDRTAFACDASGVPTGTTCYTLANAVYFIHFHYLRSYQGASQDAPSTSIEVFRLAPVPSGYKARRKVYDDPIANRLAPPTPGESPEDAYEYDFWDYVISDRKDDWGLKPELIYSDPPSQPASK